jgi:putative Mg2+ transporter-C (MgtC) family protein
VSVWELPGQGWLQIVELAVAFALSALIGLEREIRHKSAGLRTYTLVGFSAALIMLVSKYGFMNILSNNRVVLDPSRIAAQIVTGIGFIGGGLIFVRRDNVRGLTTAAIVWLTAAIGMACGAGLLILAFTVTAGHFLVVLGFPYIAARLPRSRWAPSLLQIAYQDGRDVLRDVLQICTEHGFSVSRLQVDRSPTMQGTRGISANTDREVAASASAASAQAGLPVQDNQSAGKAGRTVNVVLEIQGTGTVSDLVAMLADIPGVSGVNAGDVNVATE